MSVIEKLNDRIRSKITPEISARITAMREKEYGVDSAQIEAHRTQNFEAAAAPRM